MVWWICNYDDDSGDDIMQQQQQLGHLSIKGFTPQTVKKGKQTTERKEKLQNAFVQQNSNLEEIRKKCIGKKLSICVTFYLNKNTLDKSSYKKDLDNLLKILMDVVKEEMDDDQKKTGLGLVVENKDEDIHEIICRKKFVSNHTEEGIDLIISEYDNDTSV